MSGGRGDVERLPGGPGDPATEPSPTTPEPETVPAAGTGGPVRSEEPERSPRPGPRPWPPVPEPQGSALRVVLVSRDIMLAAALRSLIEQPGVVKVLDWYNEELDAAIRHADVVVVDMPPSLHDRAFAVLDGRFLGRTAVLLQEGEHPESLPPGPPRAILYRPLQIAELWAAITGIAPEVAGPVGPGEPDPGEDPEAAAPGRVAEAPAGRGLPVAESGLLIGLSGRELEPVIGPGQVAPGMDRGTLEQLRRWGRRPPTGAEERSTGRDEAPSAKAARAERAERAEQQRRAERAEAVRAKAADAEARREQARQAKAVEAEARAAAREEARQAKAAAEAARAAERAEARQARAAEAEARAAEREVARQVKAEVEAARKAGREAARAAGRDEARRAKAAQAEARAAAREEARQARAAAAEVRAAERAEARQAKAAQAKVDRAARAEARQAKAAQTAERRAVRAEARQAARAEAAQRRAQRAAVRKAARAEASRTRAARRDEARQARAAQAETRRSARQEAAQARAASAEVRRAEAQQAKAARAEAQEAARAEAAQQRAAQAEERKIAREESRQAKAAQEEARKVARDEARLARAARAEVRRVGREEAAQRRIARLEARRAAQAEARRARVAQGGAAGVRAGVGGVAGPALVILLLAVVGVAAAGWRAGGGPDTLAGEVAVVRAAGESEGGLVAQDPRMGPIEPLHALGVGVWLRATEAGASLEGAIREARVPSRFLLAGVVGLTVLLFLLLMRVGPGTGAAAGPGPAPPHGWRLGGAALAGALVALDPVLVRSGRTATGTVLAVGLALGALLLAWGLPARPALRWLPLVAAGAGLALLVSPLALGVLAVPVVAELLQGRHREAWRAMAALGLGIGLWLVLPVWVAGQDLTAGQAGWLLGRPPGRGSLGASLAAAPLSWLLVATGLAAAILTWRHRSGARPGTAQWPARVLAWTATTAAGAAVAVALGYPTSQALPFAVPAAAVSLALAGVAVLAAAGGRPETRLVGAATGVVLAGLLVVQGVAWGASYGRPADDGLARLVATVGEQVPDCSAVNASGPADRARLLATGATVTEFSSGPAAHAAGVRFFVLTGATAQGGPMTPSLAAWVRQHGRRLAAHPSRSLSGIELWRVDTAPLDPVADSIPVPGGLFSNVTGSACGGYRVVDSQVGAFYTGYQAAGGKAVLGRPLGSVWTSDGPALQAFDTMVLGAVPTASGPPAVRPIELPPQLAKLDVEAVAEADIPLPSARAPVNNRQTRALLSDEEIARVYLGTDPAAATASDFRRARDRFGRPLGTPQTMPDGAVRQLFERAVLELPADGGPARPAALGRLAVRLGLVPRQAMRPEPVPGLPVPPSERRLDTGPLLRFTGAGLVLLALAAAAGVVATRRPTSTPSG